MAEVSPPEVPDDLSEMPTTAFLVLGVLTVMDERLTAGEIKARADHLLGRIYWSPSVSHVRRELDRLAKAGLVVPGSATLRSRTVTVFEATPRGEEALDAWVATLDESDVVIKHPVMLRVWLARGADPQTLLRLLDQHIERTEELIHRSWWGRRRGRELGIAQDAPPLSYSSAVHEYVVSSQYSELANVRRLRDEIAWLHSQEAPVNLGIRTTPLRPRQHDDMPKAPPEE